MKDIVPYLHLASSAKFSAYDCAKDIEGGERPGLSEFLALSVALTGFSEAELISTGMAAAYFEELGMVLGISTRDAFLGTPLVDPLQMFASEFHGPLARNVIRMWYLGLWQALPSQWVHEFTQNSHDPFDEFGRNRNRVLSADAYQQALAWRAIGTNPTGARAPGFGSWAEPPK